MTTKENIAEEVASRLQLPKGQTKDIVNETFNAIGKALRDSGEVRIHGFGVFTVKDTAARTGRNPATGQPVEIAAGRKVAFKAASELKKSV